MWLSNCRSWDCISRQCWKRWGSYLHPRRSFHCRSTPPCDRFEQWAHRPCWWLSNYPSWDCISHRCLKPLWRLRPQPTRSFHCRSTLRCDARAVGALVVLVAIQLSVPGLYLPPVFKAATVIRPRRSFHCRSRLRYDRFGQRAHYRAGDCPTIRARIVSPASIQMCRSRYLRPRRSFHCRSRLPCEALEHQAH